MQQLRANRNAVSEALDDAAASRAITLHPRIAKAYRVAVRQITGNLDGDATETRDARQAIRALVDRIILTSRGGGRGMDIDIEGRLAAMLDLAKSKITRRREGTVSMVAEEASPEFI